MTQLDPIFLGILSNAYSGSTLLTALLGSDSRVAALGELNSFFSRVVMKKGNLRCSCGLLFWDCPFWAPITGGYMENQSLIIRRNFSRYDYSPSPLVRFLKTNRIPPRIHRSVHLCLLKLAKREAEYQEFQSLNGELLTSIFQHSKRQIVVDSSKSIYAFIQKSKLPNLNPRCILLVRDGRGVLMSTLKRKPDLDVQQFSKSWRRQIINSKRWLKEFGVSYLVVKYEEVCLHPEQTLGNIFRWLGKTAQNPLELDNSQVHILFGNKGVRYAKEKAILLDEQWKSSITTHQESQFLRIGAKTMQELGYI